MSKTNVFANTSDTKTIVRFVKEIERHPCLYDRKSPKYMDRDLKRRTWIYVAKKANSTVAECKDKWTKIRTAYVRTLRPSYVNGVCTYSRPYYLASHLKFIPPVKTKVTCLASTSRNKQEDTNKVETNVEELVESEDNLDSENEKTSQHQIFLDEENNSVDSDDDHDDDDDAEDDGIKGYDNILIETKDIDTKEGNKTKVKENIKKHENKCEESDIQVPYGKDFENNPRKMFLFSLLPDIQDLNDEQMKSFRREVIKLIEHVNVMY
ncbi:uncharacterized protein LOC112058331 [Bicyclus anynana]|uniref:Uncharacterized protein LOC112058331 n=1 Tax=Bicyclus anynana TaxID=110368 RepID=A0A6J1PB17_BICAN|nr:uncharacterized protein LOC112058331 [Bicyclus anynana]